ncbi:MAG: hypothetical protein ABSE89_11275 [Sedimentisphaerales bacterium]
MRKSMIDYEKMKSCCLECAKPIRKIDNFELFYNKEKLIFDCFNSTGDINRIEVPDVAGALLDAANEVSLYFQEAIGQTFEICIRAGADFQHNVVLCPLDDELACVLIAEESMDILRERIDRHILNLRHTFLPPSPAESGPNVKSRKVKVRDEIPQGYTYDKLFPDEIESPFLLIHGRIRRMERTPLVIDYDRTFRMPILTMEVSGLSYFIDRARIFIEFILHEQKETWTLTLIGTKGIVHAEIYFVDEQYYVLIGGMQKREPRKIVAWINRIKELLVADKKDCNAGIEQKKTGKAGNKLDKEHLPGERKTRVFVGGNYDYMPVLRHIKACIENEKMGFHPILAYDFDVDLEDIHNEDQRLLHQCKFAIFDETHPSGDLMEIERVSDYKVDVLVVYQVREVGEEKPPPNVSSMLTTMNLPSKGYFNFNELSKIVSEWLKTREVHKR